jgi:hypothetical protein
MNQRHTMLNQSPIAKIGHVNVVFDVRLHKHIMLSPAANAVISISSDAHLVHPSTLIAATL